MALPGFSAEASLFLSNGYHQPGVVLASLRRQGEVIPQRPPIYITCDTEKLECCLFWYNGRLPNGSEAWAMHCIK